MPSMPEIAPDADHAATAALLGALVADAVAMPVHWYYDQRALGTATTAR